MRAPFGSGVDGLQVGEADLGGVGGGFARAAGDGGVGVCVFALSVRSCLLRLPASPEIGSFLGSSGIRVRATQRGGAVVAVFAATLRLDDASTRGRA